MGSFTNNGMKPVGLRRES